MNYLYAAYNYSGDLLCDGYSTYDILLELEYRGYNRDDYFVVRVTG